MHILPPSKPITRIVCAEESRKERWHNQKGWIKKIATGESAKGDWAWQLSIVGLEQNAALPKTPKVGREFMLLKGEGLRLNLAGQPQRLLEPRYGCHRFNDVRQLRAELIDGATESLSLMWRADQLNAQLQMRPLVGPMFFFADAQTHWVVHLVSGQADFGPACGLPPLYAGDTALLYGAPDRMRYALEGSGELIVAKLTAVTSLNENPLHL